MKRILAILSIICCATSILAQEYDRLFAQGAQNIEDKHYTQAIGCFQKAIALEPENSMNEYAYSNMAFAQWVTGNSADAIKKEIGMTE